MKNILGNEEYTRPLGIISENVLRLPKGFLEKQIEIKSHEYPFKKTRDYDREEGIDIGKSEEISIGKKERNVEVAKELLKMNFSLEKISTATEISKKEIEKMCSNQKK